MLIAREKKKNNIVEYVIYMWHIEDLIRSYEFDMDKITEQVINRFESPDTVKKEMVDWYTMLISGMQTQEIEEKGHLEEVSEIINELAYLHVTLLSLYQDKQYKDYYHAANPHMEEIQKKSNGLVNNDLLSCFNGLYGVLLLRMQGKEISPATKEAVDTFSKMLGYLASKYKDMKDGKELFPPSMNN